MTGVPDPAPAVGSEGVLWDSGQAAEAWEATRYVQRFQRGGRRPPQRQTGHADLAAGYWAYIAGSAVVGGASGLTLGTGTATLCSRSGASCAANGTPVTFYNAGAGFTAPSGGLLVKLGWTDGDWSLDVAPCF